MGKIVLEDSMDIAYYAIASHAAYIDGGDDENVHYSIPPEFVEVFSWIVTCFVLPLVVNIISDKLADFIDKAKKEAIRPDVPKTEKNAIIIIAGDKNIIDISTVNNTKINIIDENRELEKALLKINHYNPPTEESIDEIKNNLTQFLCKNGWPKELASKDSQRVIKDFLQYIERQLKGRNNDG